MVATRRGTRVEPQDEADRSAAEQTPEEMTSPTSPMQTRSSSKKDAQTGENSPNRAKSLITSGSPLKSDTAKFSTQLSTRSRHRSGQSDADVSEVESTASNTPTRRSQTRQSLAQLSDSTRKLRSQQSGVITETNIESKEDAELSEAESATSNTSTRRSRSIQSLGQLTDSTRKLRSQRSTLITEPIIESKEDAELSETGSSASNTSTSRAHSRKSLGQLTDSPRKLRSLRSTLITEPIIESKEDSELSDAESHSSSVSTTARRKQPGTVSQSRSTRSRKSLLVSEPTSDVSDAESNCSSLSGVKIIATRSTRNTRARRLSKKEQTSDAESCSSGVSLQPLARRSSRRNPSNSQSDEVVLLSDTNKDDVQDQETLKKPSSKIRVVKSSALSSVAEQKGLSSTRKSSQNQPAIQEDEVILISEDDDDEPESSEQTVSKVLDVKQPQVEESSITVKADLPLETSVLLSSQSSEAVTEEIIIPDQMLRLSEDSMDKEPSVEESIDNDVTKQTNENHHDQESTNIDESMKLCLLIDSDDSEKSEHGDEDHDEEDENNMEVEEEDNVQDVERQKSKKASKEQIQNVAGDELFVIDTAPGVVTSKKYFLEPEDDDKEEDDEELGEKGEIPEPDGEEDDENNMEGEEVDNEQDVERQKSKKASKHKIQNVAGDGLFVIDTAPGVVTSKKYFLEPEDDDEEDEEELVEKGETSGSDGDDDFIDEDDENNEEEEDNEQVLDKRKSKNASKQQLQNVAGDGLFVVDTAPGVDPSKKYFLEPEDDDEEDEEAVAKGGIPGPDDDDDDFFDEDEDEEETLLNRPKSGLVLSSSIDTGINLKEMGGLYINFDAEKPSPGPILLSKMKKANKKQDELLQRSVITPDFEKKESVPPYRESQHKLKKLRKEERAKTSGRGWFDMKAPELTDDLKNDLKALKMRSAMDPKHFYKKNDREGFPKYFQVGTVVDNPIDFYHSRIPKKQRKRTIVEELLEDSEFRRYNKKKFKEITAEKAARAEGKKNRKKKKFRT